MQPFLVQDLGAQYNRELFVVSVIGIQSSVFGTQFEPAKNRDLWRSFVGKIWAEIGCNWSIGLSTGAEKSHGHEAMIFKKESLKERSRSSVL